MTRRQREYRVVGEEGGALACPLPRHVDRPRDVARRVFLVGARVEQHERRPHLPGERDLARQATDDRAKRLGIEMHGAGDVALGVLGRVP